MQGHFEAKKHAYRQTQDGIVLSLVIHPNDVTPELAAAALGTILIIGYATPDEKGGDAVAHGQTAVQRNDTQPPQVEGARKPWHTLSRAQQAGILCADKRFWEFFEVGSEEEAARRVRNSCAVDSRWELDVDLEAAGAWDGIVHQYRTWAGLEPEQRG